jgi:hypothetical protein
MKRRNGRWSFREDRKFVEIARAKSVLALAKQFGISPEAVERKLAKMGMPVGPNPGSRAEAIRQLVELVPGIMAE